MSIKTAGEILNKIRTNLPWLARYPFERTANMLSGNLFERKHVIFTIANHFEPSWSRSGHVDAGTQRRRMQEWMTVARATGASLSDADGSRFRHTYFYPGEQYDEVILDMLAELQSEGLGETEVHLHHGLEGPDSPDSLRSQLTGFRDVLADRHRLLSRMPGDETPRYAFVHGNLALANSMGGKFCGVDEEMQILAETGCYADMTLPSAPTEAQVPVINKIYECALPIGERAPHRRGNRIGVGTRRPTLPLMVAGPLVINWGRRVGGVPLPGLEDGALTRNQPYGPERFRRWKDANITVAGRPDWIFVKLYCHGFFSGDMEICAGEQARKFFSELVELGEASGDYRVHFATAREFVNMIFAAADGKSGNPYEFRDYRLRTIMSQSVIEKKCSATGR